jgi:predicted O-methyltransferase YrrM
MLRSAIADRLDPRVKRRIADLEHRLRWRRLPVRRITLRFVRHHGLTVQAGPFAGMRYPEFAVGRGEVVIPQLVGAYEQEIAPVMEEVIAGGFEQIVDVGASDGYYAVGLARACPDAVVHAYEMNPFPARVCRALAAENGVADRVRMLGEATVDELRALPERRTFVLSDCEGCEDVLMDPEAVPLLRTAMLVVELHDFAAPGIEDRIRERFAPTHDVEVIRTRARYVGEHPKLMETPGTTYVDWALGVAEYRPFPMAWAVLRPR